MYNTKNLLAVSIGVIASISPSIAFAQSGILTMVNMFTNIIMMIIPLLVSLAVLAFFWGIVKFISQAGDERSHEEGKNIMIWGMVALFVLVSFWGLVGWLQNVFGLRTGVTGVAPNTPVTIPSNNNR